MAFSDFQLVAIASFLNDYDADMAKSALDAADIESMIQADDAGGMRPHMAVGFPTRILVRAEDAERAREILETPARTQPE